MKEKKNNERNGSSIPRLSHLQGAVLQILLSSRISGKELRKKLAEDYEIFTSGPAFYQLMARLEEVKYVEGAYQQKNIDGQIIKERHYQILGNGIRALDELSIYYTSLLAQKNAYAFV